MKNIGFDVKNPETVCTDKNCPFHGKIFVHGRTMTVKVVSSKAHKTATVEKERSHFVKKYERYEKRRMTLHVHNPSCINAQEGEIVKIAETRPLSKTKHFVIVEKIK